MCLREDGSAKQLARAVTNLSVSTSGSEAYAIKRVSSITFENVLKSVKAHSIYGLTATPIRKDGHQPIIFMQCGPIRFSADAKSQVTKQSFERYLIPRFTSYRSITDDKQSITTLYQLLSEDEIRNTLIVEDVCELPTPKGMSFGD